jgi:AAA+ superfamily predicted ATPase
MDRKAGKYCVPRRKWACRGSAVADFLGGLITTSSGYGVRAVALLLRRVPAFCIDVIRLLRQSRKESQVSSRTESGILDVDGIAISVKRKRLNDAPSVHFSDVIGLEEAKREILLRSILPLRFPERADAYKLKTGGGVLMWGPPGCGKTLLAKAVAGELNADFLHVRASDLIANRIGQSEKNVSLLFREFRARKRAVLFIDEIDSLVPSRRRNRSSVMARVISEFLSQLDGVDSQAAKPSGKGFSLIIAATNWIEALDEAVIRPGRFDVRVFVGLPDADSRADMLRKSLAGRLADPDLDVTMLAELTDGFSGADLCSLVETASQQKFLESLKAGVNAAPQPLALEDLELALDGVRPSVSLQERVRYEQALKESMSMASCIALLRERPCDSAPRGAEEAQPEGVPAVDQDAVTEVRGRCQETRPDNAYSPLDFQDPACERPGAGASEGLGHATAIAAKCGALGTPVVSDAR